MQGLSIDFEQQYCSKLHKLSSRSMPMHVSVVDLTTLDGNIDFKFVAIEALNLWIMFQLLCSLSEFYFENVKSQDSPLEEDNKYPISFKIQTYLEFLLELFINFEKDIS